MLPPDYRDKAAVETIGDSNDLRVSLDICLPGKSAEELLRTINKKFPQATLHPAP